MVTFPNLGSVRLPSLKFVGLRVGKIRRIQCVSCLSTTVTQLFKPQLQKIVIFTYPGLYFFVCPGEAAVAIAQYVAWMEIDNSVLAKPLAACTHLSLTVSQLFEPQVQKIAVFTYRSPHFCFPCDYHAICCMNGKNNSVLVKPLAACTHLSSIVSELYDA